MSIVYMPFASFRIPGIAVLACGIERTRRSCRGLDEESPTYNLLGKVGIRRQGIYTLCATNDLKIVLQRCPNIWYAIRIWGLRHRTFSAGADTRWSCKNNNCESIKNAGFDIYKSIYDLIAFHFSMLPGAIYHRFSVMKIVKISE